MKRDIFLPLLVATSPSLSRFIFQAAVTITIASMAFTGSVYVTVVYLWLGPYDTTFLWMMRYIIMTAIAIGSLWSGVIGSVQLVHFVRYVRGTL